ncbi:hypothetical protein NKG05_00190 [Oerskovia sp. M15]
MGRAQSRPRCPGRPGTGPAHRAAVGSWLGSPLVFGTQVHGASVRTLSREDLSARTDHGTGAETCGEYDALVTAERGLGLGSWSRTAFPCCSRTRSPGWSVSRTPDVRALPGSGRGCARRARRPGRAP